MFVKNNTSRYPDSLVSEAEGLASLRDLLVQTQNPYLSIPQVFEVNETELHLERIPAVPSSQSHQQQLGVGLAQLHQHKQDAYGFSENNYIGLNPQKNLLTDNWGRFFVEQRLQFQIGLIGNDAVRNQFELSLCRARKPLEDFLNQYIDYPSLLHGDLWSGNVLFSGEDDRRQVWLIDPAVYYGDREVDIAMTEMFGGFSKAFYSAYDKVLALSERYPHKKVIYNLYHYLNHYNLFGNGYLDECERGFVFLQELFCPC